jgi:2-methylisocitrate lyase-like PEP mutase family enzyme
MSTTKKSFKTLLNQDGILVAPGAYDCITAMLIEQAGFSVAYMTGSGTSASLGYPDYGLLTMSETVENAGRMARAIHIPLIADADTGYGNELNVIRTVQEFESRGIAGIHIEDQQMPKKCGHLDGKSVIPAEDFIIKIRAAVAARKSEDFCIIARTDARAIHGMDEAVRRMNLAFEAGADMLFLEAPQTLAEVEEIPKRVKGPCMINLNRGGKTPLFEIPWAEKAGFKFVIASGLLLKTVMGHCDRVLADFRRSGVHPVTEFDGTALETFKRFGAQEWDELRDQFKTA